LDLTDISSRNRALTQALARALYDDGAAGVRYPSNIEGWPCVALLEGRARLEPSGVNDTALPAARQLVPSVCNELALTLVD
jgi:hypothetical protein